MRKLEKRDIDAYLAARAKNDRLYRKAFGGDHDRYVWIDSSARFREAATVLERSINRERVGSEYHLTFKYRGYTFAYLGKDM